MRRCLRLAINASRPVPRGLAAAVGRLDPVVGWPGRQVPRPRPPAPQGRALEQHRVVLECLSISTNSVQTITLRCREEFRAGKLLPDCSKFWFCFFFSVAP